jgi:hypothetical protein
MVRRRKELGADVARVFGNAGESARPQRSKEGPRLASAEADDGQGSGETPDRLLSSIDSARIGEKHEREDC